MPLRPSLREDCLKSAHSIDPPHFHCGKHVHVQPRDCRNTCSRLQSAPEHLSFAACPLPSLTPPPTHPSMGRAIFPAVSASKLTPQAQKLTTGCNIHSTRHSHTAFHTAPVQDRGAAQTTSSRPSTMAATSTAGSMQMVSGQVFETHARYRVIKPVGSGAYGLVVYVVARGGGGGSTAFRCGVSCLSTSAQLTVPFLTAQER